MPIGIKESTVLESFDGKIEDVTLEESKFGSQYVMKIVPFDKGIIKQGKTGAFWNYIRVSETAEETVIPKDSVLEKFYTAVSRIDKELKATNSVPEFMNKLKGKSYTFVSEKLGKAFGGHEARPVWLPSKLLTEAKK